MALLTGNRWVLAARPATLWASVSPVLVGSALAMGDDVFATDRFLATLAAALLIQIAVNYANDLSDAVHGADDERRVGPPRTVATGLVTPTRMRWAVAVVLALAAVAGGYLVWRAGPVILVIGVASILAALGYTGGPLPYGYRALGELFVFVFFGLVATAGTRFVYDRTAPLEAWTAGVAMGLFAVAILVANNLRDLDGDTATGKRTLAVVLGAPATRTLYTATVVAAFGVIAAGALTGWMPRWTALALLAAPLMAGPVRTVRTGGTGPALIGVLATTARLQVVTAALIATGAVV